MGSTDPECKMDEVLEKLESSALTITDTKSPKTDFECLYKNWGKLNNQEERRKEQLENQKNLRHSNYDRLRGILDLVSEVEEAIPEKIFKHKGSDTKAQYRPTIYVAGFHKTSPGYNNVLMLSEWMVQKPADFHEKWYIAPCPKGVRMLIIASRGKTKCYTKYGQFKFDIRTLLPGGNPRQANNCNMNCCCVLDGFYNEKLNTMYIIDFLAWNNQTMTDCDMEFRHYWLESQFAERPGLGVISKSNNMKLVLLPKISCALDKLNEFLSKWPVFENFYPVLDGFLFYHKETHYTAGETPLVGWLFPFMVPEILGQEVKIHPGFLADKPEDYVDQATFIQQFQIKYTKRDFRTRSTKHCKMDTSDPAETKDKSNDSEKQAEDMDSEEVPKKPSIPSITWSTSLIPIRSQKQDQDNDDASKNADYENVYHLFG